MIVDVKLENFHNLECFRNILEKYRDYKAFYRELKMLSYVGFKKLHPHDSDSILRLTLTDITKGISTIKTMLNSVMDESIKKLHAIKGCFDGTRKCSK